MLQNTYTRELSNGSCIQKIGIEGIRWSPLREKVTEMMLRIGPEQRQLSLGKAQLGTAREEQMDSH
jgi:hypothetical protein